MIPDQNPFDSGDPQGEWIDDPSVDARLDVLLQSVPQDELPAGQIARLRSHLDGLLEGKAAGPARRPIGWFRPAIAGASLIAVALLIAIPILDRPNPIDSKDTIAKSKPVDQPFGNRQFELILLNNALRPSLQNLLQYSPPASSARVANAAGSAISTSGWIVHAKQLGENAWLHSLQATFEQADRTIATTRPRTRESRKEFRRLVKWRQDFPEQLAQILRHRNQRNSRAQPAAFSEWSRFLVSDRMIFRMICQTCNRNRLGSIAGWVDDPAVGPDVCAAWSRLADSPSLAQLALSSKSDAARISLLTTLLNRGDRLSVELYLDAASSLDRIDLVLASARNASAVPAELLSQALGGSRQSHVRIAAAALSRDDREEVTLLLANMIDSPKTARGAMLALAGRSDPASTKLTSALQSDFRSSALLKTALRQWDSMTNVSTVETRFRIPLAP